MDCKLDQEDKCQLFVKVTNYTSALIVQMKSMNDVVAVCPCCPVSWPGFSSYLCGQQQDTGQTTRSTLLTISAQPR